MSKKIVFEGNREWRKFDININQYYKDLVNDWNKYSEFIDEPLDRRTNHYKDYNRFFNDLIYLGDIIHQIEQEYKKIISDKDKQIQELERALNKWTDQQKGKKQVLTKEQIEQVHKWKKMDKSNREIARRLKVSEGTIRNYLKKP